MSMATVDKKRKELFSLLKEQEDEQFLDALLTILRDQDKKEVSILLKAMWKDKKHRSAFYQVFLDMQKALEEEKEGVVGYAPDGTSLGQEDVRARVKEASKRVKEGRYTSQEEMEKKGPWR